MEKLTTVYYLQSGQVIFWQKEGASSSATVITPNAIVAKKQSNAAISYDPYEKQTVVAVYKGEVEIADLSTGKKMLIQPADSGKPRIAVIAFKSAPSSSKISSTPVPLPIKSRSGQNVGILIVAGLIVVILGFIIVKKRAYVATYYNRIKAKLFSKSRV